MIQRFVVSTACPNCGAPLDFSEGSNAIDCRHCRVRLLVTGRRQVLTYSIAAKIDVRTAASRTLFAHQGAGRRARLRQAASYFVPYYRLTGHDLRWERTLASDAERERERPGWASWLGAESDPGAMLTEPPREVTLRDRYVEKNFLACDVVGAGAGLYSLGLRPSVLRLHLFQRATLGEDARVVAPTTTPAAALVQAMKGPSLQPTLFRTVVGQALSLVYYPYWVVEVERDRETVLTFVDGVNGKIAQLDAPTACYEVLNREPAAPLPVAAFRPLACPNCGWELAMQPDDVVVWCGSCRRAWQLRGSELLEVAYEIAAVPAEPAEPVRYLPFWMLSGRNGKETPVPFFIPAFRYRRLKLVVDLARALSKQPLRFATSGDGDIAGYGCFYDQEDAAALAAFVFAGPESSTQRRADVQHEGLHVDVGTLTWVPYRVRGSSLVDPFTGRAVDVQSVGA